MSILLPTLLAATVSVSDNCNWDDPGRHRFTGDPVAAVDHYLDIPPAVRERLKARMQDHRYDEIVEIRRDAVVGENRYHPALTDMHFGRNRVCRTVTRKGWAPDRVERGLVYCESGYCLVLPTVCSNLSRIDRLDEAAVLGDRKEELLVFDPPGAGPSFAALATPGAVNPPAPDPTEPSPPGDGGWPLPPDAAPPGGVDPASGGPTTPLIGLEPGDTPDPDPSWPGGGGGGVFPPGFFDEDNPWAGGPVPPPPIPEPPVWLLLALGAGVLAMRLRARKAGAAVQTRP